MKRNLGIGVFVALSIFIGVGVAVAQEVTSPTIAGDIICQTVSGEVTFPRVVGKTNRHNLAARLGIVGERCFLGIENAETTPIAAASPNDG